MLTQDQMDSLKSAPFFYIPMRRLRNATAKQIRQLIPRKCSVCKSMKHDKRECPLVTGVGYLEVFRGLKLPADENLRKEYGWGDTTGYVKKGYKQSFTTNPFVAMCFAFSPKNELLRDALYYDFMEQGNFKDMEELGNTEGIEYAILSLAQQAYRNQTRIGTTDEDGNFIEEVRLPFVLRCIAEVTEEELSEQRMSDMNYGGRFLLEQEIATSEALKITHIGVPTFPIPEFPLSSNFLWAKYDDIPAEVFESAQRLHNWITYEDPEEIYDEEEDDWYIRDYPNAQSSEREFAVNGLWWAAKVPVVIKEELVNETEEAIMEWGTSAWEYLFKIIPHWETYRLWDIERAWKIKNEYEKGKKDGYFYPHPQSYYGRFFDD